jgi:hypothetical protein
MANKASFKNGNTAACKYKAEYIDMLRAYTKCGYEVIPTLEEFCEIHNIPERTFARWVTEKKEKYERLATEYAHMLAKQKKLLIEKGLTNVFNPQIVKFLLSNNHGMSEKTAANIDAKTDNKFEVNIKVVD